MPELPEVEVTRRGLESSVMGQTLVGFRVRESRLRYPVPLWEAACDPVLGLSRRAKYLVIETPRGVWVIHLGMTGTLRYLSAETPPQRHDHVDWLLGNGGVLRYRDPRRFGSLGWIRRPSEAQSGGLWWQQDERFCHLGPEPFDETLTALHWYRATRGKTRDVKGWLMAGHAVVGVGNIYAAESLFLAGIDPRRGVGRIGLARYECLLQAVRQVLGEAITAGGSTLRDFVDGHGAAGYFQHQHQVYGRGGQPCRVCQMPLRSLRQAQRATVYCPYCQR